MQAGQSIRVLLQLDPESKEPAKLSPDLDMALPYNHTTNQQRLQKAAAEATQASAKHASRAQLLLQKQGIAGAKIVESFALIPAVVVGEVVDCFRGVGTS
jgi:hypothetical protein